MGRRSYSVRAAANRAAAGAGKLLVGLGVPPVFLIAVLVLILLIYGVYKLYKYHVGNNNQVAGVQRHSSNLKPDNEFKRWLRSRPAGALDPPRLQEHDTFSPNPDTVLLSMIEHRSWKPRSAAETPMLVKDADNGLNRNADSSLDVLDRYWKPRSAAEAPMLGKDAVSCVNGNADSSLGVLGHRSWEPRSAAEASMLGKDAVSGIHRNEDFSLDVLDRYWKPRSAAETTNLGKDADSCLNEDAGSSLGVLGHRSSEPLSAAEAPMLGGVADHKKDFSVVLDRYWKPRSAAETTMLGKDSDNCLNGNADSSLGVSWEPDTPMLDKHADTSVNRNQDPSMAVQVHRF